MSDGASSVRHAGRSAFVAAHTLRHFYIFGIMPIGGDIDDIVAASFEQYRLRVGFFRFARGQLER